jgi:hypothetical protein
MFVNTICVIIMNKTLNNLYIKTTKEDKANVYAIHMSREMQPNKNQSCMQYTYPDKYNQTKPVETIKKIGNFFTFICHSCLYWHCTYLLKQYINIIRHNYQKSLIQIIVCLFMGGHEISIKWIFEFRTSLPINEILYIQYTNTYIQQINYLFPVKYYRRQHRIWVFVSFVQKIAI